jgi:Tol biopolymer transport system component
LALTPGTRLGPYEIVAALGAGGMGEVYRARDTNLDRDVAIKILPEAFAVDAERVARFQREAKVLASLNHPSIAIIHGLEKAGDVHALVMELVPGEDLSQRIARGAIPIDEALPIAKQIADALEAAHEQGIIHRDLKPANIKLRPDGAVKVLDFGLAKAMDPVGGAPNVSQSPTITTPAMTHAGIILGTAAYMSPEQARGKPVDRRADIWAFGVVLFEMLTSRRPFEGDEISDTLASILKSQPLWPVLPIETPAAIHGLLRRCLQKDRHQRLQHMGDARLDIEDAQRATPSDAITPRVRVARRERLLWGSAVMLAAIATAATAWRTPDAAETPEMRVEITTPGAAASQFAMAPDGRTIAFTAAGPRGRQLWLRALDGNPPRALAGTEGAEYPFWSPDQRSIGFFASNKLKRVEVDGGEPQPLANVFTPAGGTWNRDGTILYVPSDSGGIFRVSETGRDSSEVTPRRSPELATRLPQFLPNGRHFLFYVAQGVEPAGIYVGELGTDSVRRILSADGPGLYGSGHLWFVRERTLSAQMFDPSTQALSGPVSRVADNVGMGLIAASFSTSFAGPVAYRAGAGQSRRQLVWFDRSGKELGTAGEEGMLLSNPSLSRDGRHVVVQRTSQQNIDLWVLDLQRNLFERLTDSPGADSMPVWSPDGDRVVFTSTAGDGGLAIIRVDRTAGNEALRLPAGEGAMVPCDWSLDGRFVLYKQVDQGAGTTDLWALPMAGERTPFQVVRTRHDERDGQFSPDGKWIAYESDESGKPEIYFQPFPGPGRNVRISIGGGTQVRWRRDGREVFYVAPDQRLMAVVIDPAAGAAGVGIPVPLFTTHIAPIRSISRQQYVVSPDGQRFLISTTEQPPASPITLILNWKANRNLTQDGVPR